LRHGLSAIQPRETEFYVKEVDQLARSILQEPNSSESAKSSWVIAETELILRTIRREEVKLLQGFGKPNSEGYAERLVAGVERLAALDRYYRRALSRRNRVLRMLDATK
jgi:hypothetical protein